MGKKIYILIIGMLALCKIMQADVPEILWAKVYGKNTDWNYGCSVDQTNDGGFIVCWNSEDQDGDR